MTHPLARRVAGFGTTIFTEMSALALQHNAVNLGQGFPDFAAPDFVKQAAINAVNADLNQYAPMPGIPHIRQAIAKQWAKDTGREIDWQTEVSVTSGATEALCDAALSFLNPGDKAIIFEPAYDAYVPDIIMAGATPVPVLLRPPTPNGQRGTNGDPANSWSFDPDELRAAFEQRPKLIFLNTPHNPTGKVYRRDELELIAKLCQEFDVIAITDEVYDRLTYDGAEHISLATIDGMWERTLTLNSVGKTFSVTGWKIGWSVGPAKLNQALRASHQWVTFATSTPMQEATAVAIEQAISGSYYQDLRVEYNERRQLLYDILEGIGLPILPADGSYFISADISAIGYTDDRAFCRMLTSEYGVAAIPTSAFYSDPSQAPTLARFCFAKKIETLHAAAERLQKLKV